MDAKWGIDVSLAQRGLQLSQFKFMEFAILKIGGSEDGIFIDPQFLDFYTQAKNIGIPIGGYWYTKAVSVTNLLTEIDFLLEHIKGLQFEFPIFLDIEDPVSYENANKIATYWLNTMSEKGYYPGIYSSYSWYLDVLKNVSCDPIQKWVALWDKSDPGMSCGIWQDGAIITQGLKVDSDYLYADYSFIKEKGLNGFSKKVYFSDVTADMPYYGAVMEAAADGLVKGFPDGTFRPEEPVTRGQLCIILQRLRKLLNG